MNLEITKQGTEYVVVPVGGSPLKFATPEELAAYIESQNLENTHPRNEPRPQAQHGNLPDPTDTTPQAHGKPQTSKPTTNIKK